MLLTGPRYRAIIVMLDPLVAFCGNTPLTFARYHLPKFHDGRFAPRAAAVGLTVLRIA
jgi:hypothetical protein